MVKLSLMKQNNIYIPANRKLVPTKHTEVVKGKTFAALDVNVRYNKPISEEEFRERYKKQGNLFEETLYEVSSKPSSEAEKKNNERLDFIKN